MANIAKLSAAAGEMSVIRDGKLIKLNVGDSLFENDVVMGTGTITLADGTQIPVVGQFMLSSELFNTVSASDGAIQLETSDVVVEALNRGDDLSTTLDATAAGLDGGEGGGNSFVQLMRIAEDVTGNQYRYGFNSLGLLPITEGNNLEDAKATISDLIPNAPEEPVDNGNGNNGHGNNTDGQDDNNPGQGGGGPNDRPKDDVDEDEKIPKPDVDEPDTPEEEDSVGDEEEESEDPKSDEDTDEVEPETDPEVDEDGGQDPGPSEPPEVDEDEDDNPKEHQDNGKGNGVDDAPGNSGNTKGDDADGSNTPGTEDSLDPKDLLDDKKGNNGWGNGDQDAPGKSLSHNNAENSLDLENELSKHLKHLLG